MREIRKSNCHYCGYLCGFDATVEDGKLVDLQPDSSRYPYDISTALRCSRWPMNLDEIDGATRVNYPLRRVGERGSGKFERVNWDEAIDDIVKRLEVLRDEYGPQTLASAIGGPHATFWPLHRFMNAFGSPNNMGIGQICWNPRIWLDGLTYGWPIEVNILPGTTECVMLWGTNPAESDNSLFWESLKQLKDADIPLIVVDARETPTSRRADIHIMPRPGTDCYVALAFLNYIIAQGLEDRAFINEWCVGFNNLAEHVKPYTPELAEEKSGVPAEKIRQAATLFATGNASALLSGRGIDQLGPNVAPTHRCLSMLRAITGNVDKPGTCLIMEMSDFIPEVELEMGWLMTPEQRATQLNRGVTPLQCYDGYNGVDALTAKFNKHLPQRYLTSAHPGLVFDAMVTQKPYPIKALLVFAANPVVTYANTSKVIEGMKQLDLCVVLEYYLTPTAQLADYVLPAAAAFERPLFQAHGGVSNLAYGGPAAVKPYYERKTDYEIFRTLGMRLGQDCWPDETLEQALNRTMEPTGWTFDDFCTTGLYSPRPNYNKHLIPDETGKPQGFSTTSGKIELENAYIRQLGGEAFPTPKDAAIAHADAMEDVGSGKAQSVVLMTGARRQPYWASSYFQNVDFRARRPYPTVQMNAVTRTRLGVDVGEWVKLSNEYGSSVFKVRDGVMADGCANVDYGWWYPEEEMGLPGLSGALWSNINLLTNNNIEGCEQLIGSWTYNGIVAQVSSIDVPPQLQKDDE